MRWSKNPGISNVRKLLSYPGWRVMESPEARIFHQQLPARTWCCEQSRVCLVGSWVKEEIKVPLKRSENNTFCPLLCFLSSMRAFQWYLETRREGGLAIRVFWIYNRGYLDAKREFTGTKHSLYLEKTYSLVKEDHSLLVVIRYTNDANMFLSVQLLCYMHRRIESTPTL